jgi:hypothetical protein
MDDSTRHEQRSRARRNGQSASRLYVGSENGSAGVEVTRMNRPGRCGYENVLVFWGSPTNKTKTAKNRKLFLIKLFFVDRAVYGKGTLARGPPLASSPPGGGWTARRTPTPIPTCFLRRSCRPRSGQVRSGILLGKNLRP